MKFFNIDPYIINIINQLNWFQILLLALIALIIFRNIVYFDFEIVGTYISNALEPTLEMPGKGAEIYLLEGGKFSSNSFMNEGTYSIKGTTIILLNENKYQSWHLSLARRYNIGKPMIIIDEDIGYYFFKE